MKMAVGSCTEHADREVLQSIVGCSGRWCLQEAFTFTEVPGTIDRHCLDLGPKGVESARTGCEITRLAISQQII
jgi:hypothetical protein